MAISMEGTLMPERRADNLRVLPPHNPILLAIQQWFDMPEGRAKHNKPSIKHHHASPEERGSVKSCFV